jgi:hypothetical protein
VALKGNAAILREMQGILRLAAEPLTPCDNAKSRIARAAAVLSLPYRRAYSFWYGEERARVRAEEAARLRAEADRLLRLKLARLEQEIAILRGQIDAEESAGLARRQDRAVGKADPLTGGCCS